MGVDQTLTLPDGRRLGYDDVGLADGTPVLFLHGTPDSRRARHPDDRVVAELGVRLVAVDRPGIGLSSTHRSATVGSVADDAATLADHLDIERWRPFGWSGGAPYAAALAARHPDRVDRGAIVAGLVPFDAYRTPGLLDDADPGRHLVAELGADLGAEATAEMAVPLLAPMPCDLALARDHVTEGASPDRIAAYRAQPDIVDALAAGVVDAVAQGPAGLLREVELQVEPPDVTWSDAAAPIDLWYGALDHTAPVAFGEWWAGALPNATLHVVADEGHLIALTRWREILSALTEPP